ncbi:hypothetical protein F2Q69_00038542 [Brassica cretica]|uniref:Uncharacterized protein n=1 Tax=Brassica cretica TaxID=69181 RepID=A0A8S9SKP8_BRACR|nr:hypothetical protein F2Q69_00038542 [Brassica cretica]
MLRALNQIPPRISSSIQTLETLSGHVDYSFASAWHPDGTTSSTGNQDIRNLSQSLAVLKGNLGAIRAASVVAQTGLGHTWWSASTGPRNSSVKDPLGHGDAFN